MYNSDTEQEYPSDYLPPLAHHHYSLIPIKHTKKTSWMVVEKLISKWHASVGLAV